MAGKGANAGPPTGVVEKAHPAATSSRQTQNATAPPARREGREKDGETGRAGGRIERCSRPTNGRGFCAGGGGWDSCFGNNGSAVTIITMVCHAMGTIGLVVGEKRGMRGGV